MVSRALSLKSLGRRVVDCLEAHGIAVETLYLFGSHARGAETEDSDIDLLLVSPRYGAKGFWQRYGLVGRAISGLTEPVQVYPVTVSEFRNPEPGGFLESIRPELKLVYQRPRCRRIVRDSTASGTSSESRKGVSTPLT
jgi:predicted nucleotidyltransferase